MGSSNYWQDITNYAMGGRRTANVGNSTRRPAPLSAAERSLNSAAGRLMMETGGIHGGLSQADARTVISSRLAQGGRAPAQQRSGSGSSGSSGRSYRSGGGGGGGGGVNAAKQAQTSMDYITKLLASGMYTAPKQDALRGSITGATAADIGTANTAWGGADQWLAANQSNPYNDVRLQEAQVAPDQNAFLASQGGMPQQVQTRNPNDGYGGFQNILALLAANQNVNNQSQRAGAQFGRADSITGINAMDNAMLAGVTQRETDAQTALDAEKRQTLAQLIELIAQGAKAPDLAAMGVK